jgi:hypothetical protein
VGTGNVGDKPALFTWKDPHPSTGIRHIGLAAWDKFVAYRNLRMLKTVPFPAATLVCLNDFPVPLLWHLVMFSLDASGMFAWQVDSACSPTTSFFVMSLQDVCGSPSLVPSLEELARCSIKNNLTVDNVCTALLAAHALEPATDDLAASLTSFLMRHLDQVLTERPTDFLELPLPILLAIVKSSSLVRQSAEF